ncbi:MAG TPA: NB-ARC domain-containing protein [Burkholderiaceae bacterium]|nr:NB-ARC domain-containing protein [Burkholderiaceae bacterium]
MSAAVWEVRLLGGLSAVHGSVSLARFPSRPVAMLLARLALYPGRGHAREELIELLWPGVALEVGRGRLRQVLSTLRRLLEPSDVQPGSVLFADRQAIGLHPQSISSDVQDFERHVRERSGPQALRAYRGDLLPGFFDEWVEDERTRLRALFELTRTRAEEGDQAQAHAGYPPAESVAPALPSMHATAEAPIRSLPAYVSAFFGREDEQREVHEMLASHRLVTLRGFGGSGKTRLAVEVARSAPGFDTVAFVPLSECNDGGQIAEQIRNALRMDPSSEDAATQLHAFLADRDVLLVLDNFEQLVDSGGSAIVEDLLQRLPRLRCLVTSRRSLDIDGEREIAVGALALPEESMGIAEAARMASVSLFIDRARGARPDFALTERNRAALIELTRALEGLPLAIEIAASRIRAFSPQEMCVALQRRFDLLARQGPRAVRHGRHASLQATVSWSWQLLTPAQQGLVASLSVFRGGWTAAAVEAVCGTSAAAAQCEQLVADSLLRAQTDAAGITRFSMLESIREFAEEKLGAAAPELRSRHRAHYLRVATDAAAANRAVPDDELPNLQRAIESAVEDGDPAGALRIGTELRPYWEAFAMPPTVLRHLRKAQAACAPDDPDLQAGLILLALMTLNAGDIAQALDDAARALAMAGVDPARRAAALVTLALVTWEREQRAESVQPLLDEALALSSGAGLTVTQADALRVMATVVLRHGSRHADYANADALFAQAEELYRRAGESSWAHRVLLSRVGCLAGLERHAEARQGLAVCEQFFAVRASSADSIRVANMAGYLESVQERWREAAVAGRRGVQLAWERHARLPLVTALWNLPHPLAMLGEVAAAARLMSFSARFWETNVGPLSASDASTIDDVRALVAARVGAEQAATLWAAGADLSLSEAVRVALTPQA